MKPSELHLWSAPLDVLPTALLECLSEDERQRADRFLFPQHRRRFACARGFLRHILATYLKCAPEAIGFTYGPQGKPSIAGSPWQFNLSHSEERMVLAVTRRDPVGVDIEYRRPMADADAIAVRFFAPAERDTLLGLPAPLKDEAFFLCWTRKEAYIKTDGRGLLTSLQAFEVSLDPALPARLLWVDGDAAAPATWMMRTWTPAPGYVASVCLPRLKADVRFREVRGPQAGGGFTLQWQEESAVTRTCI